MIDPRERELAAALQREWDDETAAVYADVLSARGDLRGELIAIDLALAKATTRALVERKRALIRTWIGGDQIGDWSWQPRNFRSGLLRGFEAVTGKTYALDGTLEVLFRTVGSHIRELSLSGKNSELRRGLLGIAERPLPWLAALSIHRLDGATPFAKDVWSQLVDATPNLRTLTVTGQGVVLSPVHPAIHTLRLTGPAIAIGRDPVPSIVELGLTFTDNNLLRVATVETAAKLAGLVNPRTFPGLRRVDLSSNQRLRSGPPITPVVTTFLDAVAHLDAIERVRIPPVDDEESAAALIAILERHPHLEIEIARMHTNLDAAHPRLHLPPPRAWPGSFHSRDALDIAIPAEGVSCDELALSSLVDDLEGQFDDLAPDAQRAWLAFWGFLDGLPWEDEHDQTVYKPFSAATLSLALEALDGNRRADNVAAALRTARLAPDAEVTISRYWGW